ncbi:MAG TPA: hypothetical protein VK034_31695, partial [Enhygromyxa sp.]|nr:hypothetical protein [Enhygromyxa sp.]
KKEVELESKALAEIESVDAGHTLWMDASGAIYRCSPTCTTLWLNYGDVLTDEANALIRRDLKDLEKRAARAAANGSEAEAKRVMLDAHQLEGRLKHARAKKPITKLPSAEELLEQKGYAHDMGVKHGQAYAQSSAGGNLKPAGFVNPFEHIGSHGQGFDDIMGAADDLDKADVFIVEYKGGTAKLSDGQMELAWVLGNIRRLAVDGGDAGRRWADTLMRAFREGRLKGVAFSTELDGAAVKPTKKIQEWSYKP